MQKQLSAWLIVAAVAGFSAAAFAAGSAIPERLSSYKAEGAGDFSAARGEAFWNKKHDAPADDDEGGKPRSCTTCHNADLTKAGSHVRSGKVIEPMALSVNAERYTDPEKIEKWFLRNCKWTLGRECTAQEKGDVLTYLGFQ